jgi:hypothetical protein
MSVLPTDVFAYGSVAMPGFSGSATLNGAITTTTATSVPINTPTGVPDGTFFPASGEFLIEVDNEFMWVTQGAPGGAAGTLTVIRGFLGSTAATHLNAAVVNLVSGGPVDFLTGVAFTDVGTGDSVDITSSSASDTKQIISVAGRDVAGNFVSGKNGTLNGQAVVAGVGATQLFDRLLYVGLGAGTTLVTTALTAAATSMSVAAFTNFPTSGQYYVLMGREIISVTAGQGTVTWTIARGQLGTTATPHNIGDNVYLLPFGDVAVYDHTPVVLAHTMQAGASQSSGTTPALTKLQAGDGSTVQLGQIVIVTNNLPAGAQNQIRVITAIGGSYGTDVVAVDRDWDVLPTSSTTYNVVRGWKLPFKTGSGVGATVNNQIVNMQRALWGAVADVPTGATRTYYEKIFVVNNNPATDLTAANIQISSNTPTLPGSALLDIALDKAVADTFAAANRNTLPTNGDASALVFVTQPAQVNIIAGVGALVHASATPNAAQAQGVWLRATIPPGTSAYKGSANLRTQGNTI